MDSAQTAEKIAHDSPPLLQEETFSFSGCSALLSILKAAAAAKLFLPTY